MEEATAPAPQWAAWAAYAVPLCVLPSAVWRVTLVVDGKLRTAGEAGYVLALSGLSMGFALLTLGLVHRWGERVPGWVPWLGGRTIPVRAAFVPAVVGASLLIAICLYAELNAVFHFVERGPVLIGRDETDRPPPGASVDALYAPMLAWGPLVLAVALNYRRRRQVVMSRRTPSLRRS